ncbi:MULTISPECIES: hypothetical protein [unclassified Sphingomonas]|uniref:hypothetical protein n=1 Tax=unclassified Sphingomonas TaxID=196159 RepID=UPI001D12CB94|nr:MULTISPECIES: hypothetical protein [unclassified Sphingomonas]MCC2980849.1 hypothetical protein [Sphingomonas sp. IC4-52]MCD2317333.1 hypothetical protein [Sphingomonas sp. IC-11]
MAVTSRAIGSGGGRARPALLLGAAAVAALLGGCGSRSEPAEPHGIVVVKGGGDFGSLTAGQARLAAGDPTAFAGAADGSSSDVGEPLAPDVAALDDPIRDAAITAKREADPYRISAVDPDALAAAGISG